MNKTYKIMLPRNKEAQNVKTNIKDGTIEVEGGERGELFSCFHRPSNSNASNPRY